MPARILKRRVEHRFPSVNFFPDRFLVVVLSAVLTWKFNWEAHGLEIMGPLKETGSGLFAFRWPLLASQMKHIRASMATSFIISLLGFFESSVAAKALGEEQGRGIQDMTFSANRELVALGVGNIVSGCFMGLPSFGGYGRSKLNAATGAKTPMSSIFLGLITFFCLMFMMRYLFYLPVSSDLRLLVPSYRHRVLIYHLARGAVIYDFSCCIYPRRGMPPRYTIFHPITKLVRPFSHASHFPRYHVLLPRTRYCPRHRTIRS